MKHCKNCNLNFSDKENFCEKCGKKLIKLIKEGSIPKRIRHDTKLSMRDKTKFIIGGIATIIVIIILFWLLSFTSSTTEVVSSESPTGLFTDTPGITQNCRFVEEPYTVQVPYTYNYKHTVLDATYTPSFSFELGEYTKAQVTIANSEDIDGVFTVNFNFRTLKGGTTTKTINGYVTAHSTEVFTEIYDNSFGEDVEFTYSVSPPTETRYNEEIRYRTVEKCE